MEAACWPSPPQQSPGLETRATYLTAVTAGAMGTLRPLSQGAVGGVAAGVITFLGRQWERREQPGQQGRAHSSVGGGRVFPLLPHLPTLPHRPLEPRLPTKPLPKNRSIG